MKEKNYPRPKGTNVKQHMYFHNYQWYRDAADEETGSLRLVFKRKSLQERCKGLILQNPQPLTIKKEKIK